MKHFDFHCFSDRRRRNIRWGHGFWHSLYLLFVDQVFLKFVFFRLNVLTILALRNWFCLFSFSFSAIFQIIQSIRMGMWVPVFFTCPALHLNEIFLGDWIQSEGGNPLCGQKVVCWAGSSVQFYMTLSHMFTVSLDEGNTCFSTEPLLLLKHLMIFIIFICDWWLPWSISLFNRVCVSLFQINAKHIWIMPHKSFAFLKAVQNLFKY